MDRKTKITNTLLLLCLPIGTGAVVWAVATFPIHMAGVEMAVFAIVTVFFSSYLSVQLPRTKLFLTVSDALILLSLFVYGGQTAVLLAACEACFASFNLRRRGHLKQNRTILVNVLVAVSAVMITHTMVTLVFVDPSEVLTSGSPRMFLGLLVVMALTQFLVTSIGVSLFVAATTDKPIWRVWYDDCLNVLLIFVCASIAAGLMALALQRIDIILVFAVIIFFALTYLTYRRSATDVEDTAKEVELEKNERMKAAEQHLAELESYVSKLERTGRELAESRESFRHAANHDALTNLPNRTFFIARLKDLLEQGRQDPECCFAVMFLDLNRFRHINDSLGHTMGDRILRGVAKRLVEIVRETDFVGHFGGDEFAIICNDADAPERVFELAEKVNRKIAECFRFKGRQVFTSVSTGIAFGRPDYRFAEDILREADIAMYNAKDYDRSYAIFDQSMRMSAISRQRLETDLRYAIVCNELELFYQPIVDLSDGRIAGFEALVRWNHPTRGLVSPSDFIPIAESTGLIVPITNELLRDACRQLGAWTAVDRRHLTISVNLSGKHFGERGLADRIAEVLAEHGVAPERLKLEITESALMENAETTIAMLNRIKQTGVKISIDDFGTGYSSLSYLNRFPIDTLKVDQSFVSAMNSGTENREIVRTVIALATTLGLDTIAEGIETDEQLQLLRELGCDYGQGYLFSRPIPKDEADLLLIGETAWNHMFRHSRFLHLIGVDEVDANIPAS
ncbi:hypothetical protein BH24ACI3_BH24ACI3_00700 [soil metagenome]